MPLRRRRRRAYYFGIDLPQVGKATTRKIKFFFIFVPIAAIFLFFSLYLRDVSAQIAISDAQDIVNMAINDAIYSVMTENNFDSKHFVSLEKDSSGNITAITTNMTNINSLSTTILSRVVEAADSGELDIKIPLGNLLGSNLLLGKGPDIPVEIIMLTSSFVDFENEFISTGINQTKHRITLLIDVDIDILIPWATMSTRVETAVIIAETIIVGNVPNTYVDVN